MFDYVNKTLLKDKGVFYCFTSNTKCINSFAWTLLWLSLCIIRDGNQIAINVFTE